MYTRLNKYLLQNKLNELLFISVSKKTKMRPRVTNSSTRSIYVLVFKKYFHGR